MNPTDYYHYKFSILRKKIIPSDIRTKEGTWSSTKRFQKPVTHYKLPKIYIIKNKTKIVYVGITSRSIANRLRDGLTATGEKGYYGYDWKDSKGKIDLLIWCFNGEPPKGKRVESLEAEIVFAIRNKTRKWPYSQTEIHFHNVTDKEIKLAESIYKEASNA